ncbi:MAG: spermine synthase [Gammaproteobacteria bacterium]|nr:MAG: spermine synthase [Gammaproteobacteria bacterium]
MKPVPAHLGSVLMLGVVSQLAQVVMLRELLMVFHGNELSIGIILAAWLIWVGVGTGVGTVLAERSERILALLALNAVVLLPVLASSVLASRALRGIFEVVPGAYLALTDIVLGSLLLLLPVGVLLGMQFVLLAKLWRLHDRNDDTLGAGKTYIGEALGNIIGGMAFSLLLVHYLNAFEVVVLAGLLVVLAVLWAGRRTTGMGAPLARTGRLALLGVLFVGILGFGALPILNDYGHRVQWRSIAPEHELLEVRQSRHGNISIARRDDQLSFYRSGHLMFAAAGPDAASAHFEEQEAAVFAHFGLTQHPYPKRVLLIGGGLRGTLGEILKHPVDRVDYVELDEVLTEAARHYLGTATLAALASPRVHLIHRDGRLFLKESRAQWDVILVDVPDPATAVLNRFYTTEFFAEARARLADGGLLVVNSVSTPGLRGRTVANRNATVRHTLARHFEQMLVVGDHSLIYLASDSPDAISAAPERLIERYRAREVRSQAFSPGHFALLLEPGQLARVNWVLRHHGRDPEAHRTGPPSPPLRLTAPLKPTVDDLESVNEHLFINSDFRPVGYFHTLMFWGDLTGSRTAEQLGRLLDVRPGWIALPAVLVLGLIALLRLTRQGRARAPDRQLAVGLAVFTTGLSTMAMQVALLFAFQSLYGFVYEMLGLIVAIFMAGLAGGTALTQARVRLRASLGLLAGVQGAIALFALLIALLLPLTAQLPSANAVFVCFAALTFIGGVLNGVDFPLTAAAFSAANQRPERSAGMVYGIELFGACTGAALASVLIAPILGIVACFLLAAIVNGTALVALMIARR